MWRYIKVGGLEKDVVSRANCDFGVVVVDY